jgi:hypothetical protein
MPDKYWKRRLNVTVAGVGMKLDDFHCEFQIRQMDVQHPDWAYIRIVNLKEGTSTAMMQGKKGPMKIEAGYHKGPYGEIFSGNIDQQRRGKLNGTDTYHDALGSSGGNAYTQAVVRETIPKGGTLMDAFQKIFQPMQEKGVKQGYIPTDALQRELPNGWTLMGMSKDLMRTLAETIGASWTIQNNEFRMTQYDKSLPGKSFDISATNGLIGIPEQQLTGVVARILINPDIKVHQQIRIDPKIVKRYMNIQGVWGGINPKTTEGALPGISEEGTYKVVRVDHDGSMRGQEWYTTLTCLAPGQEGLAAGAGSNQTGGDRSLPEVQQSGGGAGASGANQ